MNFPFAPTRLARGLATAALAALMLSACGGGTQVDLFQPKRVLAFGDELSYMTSTGGKYSTSLETDADGVNCLGQQLWIQYLASHYDMSYPQCKATDDNDPKGRIQSTVGATVDDFIAQTESFSAADSFGSSDMVTVMVGMHDVLAAYARYPAESETTLRTELRAKGKKLAQRINSLTNTGARVLVSTVHDIGLTPFALAEKAENSDVNRATLLSRMVEDFNTEMRLNLVNDGSKIGLLLADDLSRSMSKSPSAYGLTNVSKGVCAVALPNCTSKTLIDGGSTSAYLWADDLHPAAPLQLQLGFQAVARVGTNPF